MKHNIPPVYDESSRVLILGSFPSVRSREAEFFYSHPKNRFWRVLASVMEESLPTDTDEKKKLLLDHCIALWDVISSCDVTGSSDASIKNAVPNDLSLILDKADIRMIFVNGKTAKQYYDRYLKKVTGIEAVCLPSTSPANAAWSADRLCEAWGVIKAYCR